MGENAEQATADAGKVQDTEKVSPSSVSDAYQLFQKKQSEKAKAKEKPPEEPSDEGKDKDKGSLQPPEEEKKPQPFPYKLVDEDGNPVPFKMKVDGKEISETDLNKVLTWAQVGFHGNKRLEEVNLKEKGLADREKEIQTQLEELKTNQAMLDKFRSAIEEGRLVINPPGSPKEEGKKEEEELDPEIYSEPALVELKKENIGLKKQIDKLVGQQEATNKLLLGKLVSETKDVLDAQITEMKSKYPLLKEKEVWDYLAEVDDKGKPTHDVESAAKLSHESRTSDFQTFLKENPDVLKKDEEDQKKIIAKYLEDKEKAEEAPVSAPSGGAAQTPSSTPKKKKEYANMAEAAEAANEWLRKRMAAKSKL